MHWVLQGGRVLRTGSQKGAPLPLEKALRRRKLSGPVLRDTARLSQRYPLLRAMGFLVSQHGQLGAIPPPPFLSISPLESMRSGGAIPPPQKGYLSDTSAIPYENKANGCDTPLCDTISKGYCKRYGWVSRTGPLRAETRLSSVRPRWRVPYSKKSTQKRVHAQPAPANVLEEFSFGRSSPRNGLSRKRAEYGFGEYGFKHRTQ